MITTESRKKDHLRICLEDDVEVGTNCLEDVTLVHNSLPDLDLNEIDISTTFLGKELKIPLIIAAITGGVTEAREINRSLAEVAEKKGIAMGIGSQRKMIENPEVKDTYYIRDVAPNILFFGNIGIAQLRKYPTQTIQTAVESIDANALCVHINPAQEVFQNEGDFDFRGCLEDLEKLCSELSCPVVGKEVGNGMTKEVAFSLKSAGVKAIDVGGFGGTSWIVVDSLRSNQNSDSFKNWGIPTAVSILEVKNAELPIIATGGVRTGLDMAKSIALGASICGVALPFLRILKNDGKEGLEKYVDDLQTELKKAMFLCGCKNMEELKNAKYVLTGKVKDWADQRKLV